MVTEHKPDAPGPRWWCVEWLYPDRGSWRFSPLPTIEHDRHGREQSVEVHWLVWGVRVWWTTW